MKVPRQYATARAFRTALEAQLLNLAWRENTDLQRLRRQVAFDRLLHRLAQTTATPAGQTWVLKGGYALELRLALARSTRDLDLTVRLGSEAAAQDRETLLWQWLIVMGRADTGDFFAYRVGAATLELDGAPEGGWRYPVEARLDGRTFAKFHLDVGLGDEVLPPVEIVTGHDWLGFAGLPPAAVPTLSTEQQWAETLHAYTRPRDGRANSRVKDLVDLLLLVERGSLVPLRLNAAVAATFARRATHAVPADLPPPPPEWRTAFAALAAECGFAVALAEGHQRLARFWKERERA